MDGHDEVPSQLASHDARTPSHSPLALAPRWLLTGLLLVSCFLLLNRALVLRRATPVWDADTQAMPWQSLVADHARSGHFLLWNPWTNGGSPDFAEPQIGAFSPLTVLVGLLTGGTSGGFIIYWLLVWCLGGVGMLLLARHLGTPPWGGFVAALGFLFSGLFTGHAEHMSFLHALAWLPFVIWRLDVALSQRRLIPALQAGALWGFSALAGYPGLVLLAAGFCCLWVIGRVVTANPDTGTKVPWRFALACLILLGFTGLIILSPTYGGFLVEARGYTERVGHLTPEMAATNALDPGAILSFASPYMNSLHLFNVDELWAYTDVSSSSLYVSPLVFCLALYAIVVRRRSWSLWLLGIGIAAVLFSMAKALPFHGWLYTVFPPLRFTRHPAIFRNFAILALVILSFPALRDLDNDMHRHPAKLSRLFPALLAGVACVAIMTLFVSLRRVTNPGDQPTLARFHCVMAWTAIPIMLLLVRYRQRLKLRPALLVTLLMAFAIGDASFALALTSHTVYNRDPAALQEWNDLDSAHTANLDLAPQGLARKAWSLAGAETDNKNLPVKIPVFRSYSVLKNPYHEPWARNLRAASLVSGTNRIWFCEESTILPPNLSLFEHFLNRAVETKALPMLVHDPETILEPLPKPGANPAEAIATAPLASRIPTHVITYTPQVLEIQVTCPTHGWLLVTDRWARGWQVSVNDTPAKPWCGAFIFRAVEVPAGMDRIRFEYRPWGYPWLLILSWGLLATIAVLSAKRPT